MSDSFPNYLISLELRNLLVEKLTTLEKDNVFLQSSLKEQQTQTTAQTEDLFLELLEVVDALEALLYYLENNPHQSPEFIASLPHSVSAVHRQFLGILKKTSTSTCRITSGNRTRF
ncbi:MAG: nucleotide exchange factor GrpE [Dolichospermum sp.]